jgi:hypothetical protein
MPKDSNSNGYYIPNVTRGGEIDYLFSRLLYSGNLDRINIQYML